MITSHEIHRRFGHHRNGHPPEWLERIRAAAVQMAEVLREVCPEGPEQTFAVTNLEQSVMWAQAAITRMEAPPNG